MLMLEFDEHFPKCTCANISCAVGGWNSGISRAVRHDLITLNSKAHRSTGFEFHGVQQFILRPKDFQGGSREDADDAI